MKSISRNIDVRLAVLGFGRGELATRLGVSRQTLWKWEQLDTLARSQLDRLALALRCDRAALLADDPEDAVGGAR